MSSKLRLVAGVMTSIIAVFCVAMIGCTTPETSPAPVPTATSEAVAVSPTDTPEPAPTATRAPPTPTYTAVPTDTPVPPTETPAPTFTPVPQPTATPAAKHRRTYTPRPRSTPTSIPTFAPRPTNTPAIPSAVRELENGEWLADNERTLASQIAKLPWVVDGLEAGEMEPAQRLVDLALWFPKVFAIAIKQEWLGDDVTGEEAIALAYIRWLAFYGDEFPAAISRKSWFSDGITASEATVIQNLYRLVWDEDGLVVQENIRTAAGILSMPFLDAVDGADALAVRSLRSLEYDDEATYLKVMAHPKIDDGITDEEAKTIALLGGTYSYRPESGDVLLRGTGVYWDQRTVALPLSGDVSLAVVRIRDQNTSSMDFLEHSVRTIEEFMRVELPTTYIALLYDDAVFPGSGGTNFGTHMAMQLAYDVENSAWWDYTPFVIGHEVAHYYWHGNSNWIDEGAAEILGSISEFAREETPIDVTNNPCAAAETIGELEAMDPDALGTRGFNCNYSLGERLFLDLYQSLGEETFRQGFRSLYLKSQAEDYSDACEGTALGICHLVAAFKADVSDGQAAQVDEIVARWYGPLP